MPKARNKRKNRRPPEPVESSAAEAATVAWLLSVMTSAICEIGAIVAGLVAVNRPDSDTAKYLYVVLTFGAVVVSVVALILTAVVWKTRVEKPPRPLVILAVAVGCFPFLLLLAGRLM